MPYKKLSDAPPNIRRLREKPTSEPIPLTLAQVNWIANVADGIKKGNPSIKTPWAVAIANFKRSFEIKDGRWMKREKSEKMQAIINDFLIFGDQYYRMASWQKN